MVDWRAAPKTGAAPVLFLVTQVAHQDAVLIAVEKRIPLKKHPGRIVADKDSYDVASSSTPGVRAS